MSTLIFHCRVQKWYLKYKHAVHDKTSLISFNEISKFRGEGETLKCNFSRVTMCDSIMYPLDWMVRMLAICVLVVIR